MITFLGWYAAIGVVTALVICIRGSKVRMRFSLFEVAVYFSLWPLVLAYVTFFTVRDALGFNK